MTVNPMVLEWARNESGFSLEEAADLLRLPADLLAQYESGQTKPGLGVLRDMSVKYEFDLATLFMPQRLPPTEKPTDYRTIAGAEPRFSPDTLRALRRARALQEDATDLIQAHPDLYIVPPLPAITLDDDVVELARVQRDTLTVDIETQLSWTSPREAFWNWRWRVEDSGVIVTIQKMPRHDCRGFSLVRPDSIPTIVVNGDEVDQAQCFSLLHEYCHVLLRSGGLCDESARSQRSWRIEKFCNLFAANVLMPEDTVHTVLSRQFGTIEAREFSVDELTLLARRLRVSRPAMALRLEELALAPPDYYERVTEEIDQEDWVQRDENGGGFAQFKDRVFKELGVQYTGIVLEALSRRFIDDVTADNLLGAASKYHGHFAEQLAVRGQRYGRR